MKIEANRLGATSEVEVHAATYSTRYQWVEPGLARMERLHQWGEQPTAIIDVIGQYWGLGFTQFESGLVAFGRRGQKIQVSGEKCIFIPPYSIFESHIGGGSRKMHWIAFISLEKPPEDLPKKPIIFDFPKSGLPKSFQDVFEIIRNAVNVVEIGKEEEVSAVALKTKSYLDIHYADEMPIQEIANQLKFSHAVMDRAFKKCFGISPVAYRARIRTLNAAFVMTLGGKSVSEAAMQMGFSSLDHFTRQFRRFVSARPMDYLASLKGTR